MTYDTTLLETLSPSKTPAPLPECLKRDRLNAGYFAQFTAAQLAMVIALSVIFLWTGLHKLNHTDLWGHLDFGRWIAQHQSLPAIDPFAATPSNIPFVPSAWLAQVLGYFTIESFGLDGLVLAHASLATLACGVMIGAIYARGVPLCWSVAGGIAYYILSLPIVGTIRPQLFGMVGAPLALLAVAQLPKTRWPLVWLPLMFTLWANLHGSFVMGLAMLALCAAGQTWMVFGEKRDLRHTLSDMTCMRLWSALGLALLGASLNPIGPHLFINVLGFGKHAALADISEWRSLTLSTLTFGLFAVSVIGAFVSLKFAQRRWELSDLLLLTVFALATISAMRMLAWWAAIWPWAVLPYAVSAWQAKFPASSEPATPPNAMRTLLAVGFVFMTLLIAPPSNQLILGQSRAIGAVASPDTPVYVADEIARRKLQGNFYSPMDWADYLVWQQPEGFRPLAYTHVHLLAPPSWQDFQQLAAGSPEWLRLADSHRLRYLVISKERNKRLAGTVFKYTGQQNSRATILYQDQQSLLVELRPAT